MLPSVDKDTHASCQLRVSTEPQTESNRGLNAGKVWQLLSNNEKLGYGTLKRKSGLKDKELGAALGWLSRENKIEFDQCDEELYVYLCVNVYIG